MAFHNVPPNGFPDLPDMEEMEAVVKDVTNLKTSVSDLTEDVEDLASGIAPEFSAESAYTADDIVWHEGALYVFTSDHAAGAWSTDDTQALTVGGEITTLSGNVSDLNSGKANQITIAPFFNPEAEYEAGDLVYYNGLTYRCTNDHQGAWDAADFAATTIANELDTLKSGLTNVIAKSMFGGYSTYYRTTQTTIDDIIDTGITTPQTDDAGYFSCENRGTIVGYGVRQFVFGWINTTKLFAWIVVCSYDGIYVGRRANTSTFTITKLSD